MRKLYTGLVFLLLMNVAHAQLYKHEYGFSLGGANYLGEITSSDGPAKPLFLDMGLSLTRYSVGGYYRYNVNRFLSVRGSLIYGRISGGDSLSNEPTRRARNLSFRTDIVELSAVAELYVLRIRNKSRTSRSNGEFATFLYGGIGGAFFNPMAEYKGKWYRLQPLATEGYENFYQPFTAVIPLGLGLSYSINRKIKIGLNIGYRMTFTDYLDDVSTDYAWPEELPYVESFYFSQRSTEVYNKDASGLPHPNFYQSGSIRGNPDTMDGYAFGNITFGYIIKGKRNFYKSRYRGQIKRRKTKF